MSDNPLVETADKFYETPATSEPIKPTDEADVTNEEVQAPQQDVENLDNPDEPKGEAEESESNESETEGDDITQYVEIDGKEISVEEFREGRDRGLRQADYTKKTTDHARYVEKERGEIALDRETLLKSQSEVSEMSDLLTVLVQEDEVIDWVELKEDDPDRYIELKELADKRKDALNKVKAERETPADDPAVIAQEREKFFNANPDWIDDKGQPTEAYTKDTSLVAEYAAKAGFSQEEFGKMSYSHHMITMLKAAKYDELQEKCREIKSKREKVPVVTKPKAKVKESGQKSAAEIFYGT